MTRDAFTSGLGAEDTLDICDRCGVRLDTDEAILCEACRDDEREREEEL